MLERRVLFTSRVAAVLATVLVLAGAAQAYELERIGGDPCQRSRQYVFWNGAATKFSVESLSPIDAPLAREEAQAWSDTTLFTFTESPQRGLCDGGDGVVSMGFADELCDGTSFGANVLAVTLYRFNGATGEMSSAEVVFNPAAAQLAEEASFRTVALHELGHVVGLAHSDACGGSGADSVMRAVLRRDDPRPRVPGGDDIDGADFIYSEKTPTPTPTATPTGPTPTPRADDGGGCRAGSDSSGILGALLTLCALLGSRLAAQMRRRFADSSLARGSRGLGQN